MIIEVRPIRLLGKVEQVENHLRTEVSRWSAGDELPPERELAAMFGVSRATVREALRGLEIDGLSDRGQGRGTVIT